MDIKGVNPAARLKMYEVSKKGQEAPKSAGAGKGQKSESPDKITISQEAKSLNILDFVASKVKFEMSSEAAEVNTERIAALRERIAGGEYSVSSADIASAIIGGAHGA